MQVKKSQSVDSNTILYLFILQPVFYVVRLYFADGWSNEKILLVENI